MTDRLDLPPRYLRIVQALLREHVPDAEVWAYGSRVNGSSHEGSDLDLVVRGPGLEPLGGGFLNLLEAIEESNIPILVQIHDWARLPESFHPEIERDYVVVQKGASADSAGLSGEWRELPFSDAVLVNPAVRLERGVTYPFVDMAAVNADSRSSYPSEQREFRGGGSRFHNGDTLMARITPCLENGKIAHYHAAEAVSKAHGSTEFIVIRGRPDVTDNDFAYYLTKWNEVREYAISQMTGTSGRQRVPVGSLDHLTVPVPSLPEQRAIAHVLGALDDKIELNRRMNETLEAMARALFKSWFVDFDPVRAKAALKRSSLITPPRGGSDWSVERARAYLPAARGLAQVGLDGMDDSIADLFPDRLVDSELGPIPEGWEFKSLSECIKVARGLSYKGSGLSSDGMPMHNLNSVYEGGGYKEEGIKYYNGNFKERHVTQPGDVLVANTEQGHDRLLIGFAAIIPERFGGRSLFSHHLYRIRPERVSGFSPDFMCQLLNTQAMHDNVSGYATGTTVNMLPRDALTIPGIVVPPPHLVATFSAIAQIARSKQEQCIEESRTLAAQRDELLSKLVSGQLRVGQ